LSWTSNKLFGCAAALALCAGTAAAAETIVVKSSGPSARTYPPGKSIPDASKVALKAGDVVTILDGRGTRVFRGPGVFSTTASTTMSTSIGTILKNTGARQVRTGAVRGVATVPVRRPTNIWLLDGSKSGTVCFAGTEGVSLWMPSREQPSQVMLTRVSDAKSASVEFGAGQSIKSWPLDQLPLSDGQVFRISGAGSNTPVTLKFAAMGPNPQGLENTAAAFIKAGCDGQLDTLIEMVAVPGGDEPTAG
jgi:hypothetical protein